MELSMTGQEKDDLLIKVTAWECLTVLFLILRIVMSNAVNDFFCHEAPDRSIIHMSVDDSNLI